MPWRGLLVAVCCAGWVLPAWADSLQDLWIRAQQAFSSRNLEETLDLVNDILRRSPNHGEARRMGAQAARDLGRFSECLRLIVRTPERAMLPSDVGLLGECSYENRELPRYGEFLRRQLRDPNNRDFAAFWLGKESFRDGRADLAREYLSLPAVLPQRLESERQELLRRLRSGSVGVRRPRTEAGEQVARVTSGEPQSGVALKSVRNPYADPVAVRHQALQSFANVFWIGALDVRTDVGFETVGDEVRLDPFAQEAYERSRFQADSIYLSSRAGPLGSATLDAVGGLHYRTSADGGMSLAGETRVNVAATAAQEKAWLYRPPHAPSYPDVTSWFPGRGWNLGLAQGGFLNFGRTFSLFGEVSYDLGSNLSAGVMPVVSVEGGARLESREIRAESRVGWMRHYGADRRAGMEGMHWWLNVDFDGFARLAFRTPEGVPLVRFAQYAAIDGGSRNVVNFLLHEGRFWELNFLPMWELSRQASLYFWFRQVLANERQFWSAAEVRENYGVDDVEQESSVPQARQPVAKYSQRTTTLSLGFRSMVLERLWLDIGVGYRRQTSAASDYAPDNIEQLRRAGRPTPAEFADLLSAGGHKAFVVFASSRLSF